MPDRDQHGFEQRQGRLGRIGFRSTEDIPQLVFDRHPADQV
jgi:hypothetical protein